MQLEVARLVTNSKVVLGHLGLGGVEGHLVTGEPSLVADHRGTVDGWACKVEVNVAAQVDVLAFVCGLDFSALFSTCEEKHNLIKSLLFEKQYGFSHIDQLHSEEKVHTKIQNIT